jgi:hypothetical protein
MEMPDEALIVKNWNQPVVGSSGVLYGITYSSNGADEKTASNGGDASSGSDSTRTWQDGRVMSLSMTS